MLFGAPISAIPFGEWLKQDAENRRLLRLVAIAFIIQFAVFKFLYPFPNFMPPDSNSYLEAAFNNQVINMWPIGYSMFLRMVSSFSNSHFFLITLQYILLQVSLLYFLFTLRYLLAPGKRVFRVLLFLNILNPLLLHISNFVSSDALFITLSLVWFTQLLRIVYKPDNRLLVFHSVVLLLAFIVRYYALYYPFISIGCILFSKAVLRRKIMGVTFIVLLLGTFIVRTIIQYNTSFGTHQFSAFGGWQMAANGLYGYAHSSRIPAASVPVKFRTLHAMVDRHIDSIQNLLIRPDYDIGVYYLWDEKAPLKQFMHYTWRNDDSTRFLKRWASMGPLYSEYGSYLISKRPGSFATHFLWPNLVKFYAPPSGFLGEYNISKENVDDIAVSWFGWKNNKVSNYFHRKIIVISSVFQIVSGILNFLFVISLVGFVIMSGFKNNSAIGKQVTKLALIVWISNLVFSVVTAPIEIRYQLFSFIISTSFTLSFISYIIKSVTGNVNAMDSHRTYNKPVKTLQT